MFSIYRETTAWFRLLRAFSLALTAVATAVSMFYSTTLAQNRRRPVRHVSVCGNPTVPCKTSVTFQPNDLPFRVPKSAIIFDTELFYAVILKSVGRNEEDCDVFVTERERLETQALFPDHKVFTSRCAEPGTLFYTNSGAKHRFMAVYAGTALQEANRILTAAKASGKFPGANLRRMRTGFNGT